MKSVQRFPRNGVLYLPLALAGLGVTGPVLAQTAAGGGASLQLEEVIVTGTRLQAAGFNAPTPVTVVGAETIEQRAPANISDVVLEQPAFRIANTDTIRNGAGNNTANPLPQGLQATLDLRSMGAQRTLTLINGHRSVATNWQSTVDSNIVPVGLVERIEVVTGGASAAYGSDAVAGVANIILRNKMQGIRANVQSGFTEYSTAKQYTFSLAGGTSFLNDRLHLIGGVDYNKTEEITDAYGKKWGRDEIGNVTFSNADRAAGGLPQTVITTGVEPASTAPGGLFVAGNGTAYTFDTNGNPVVFPRGQLSSNGQFMVGSTSNYGRNLNNLAYLRLPNSRFDTMARMSFDMTDNLDAYLEVGDSRSKVDPYKAGDLQQGTGFGTTNPVITIGTTNPFRTTAINAVTGTGQFTMGRNNTEFSYAGISGNAAEQESHTWRVVAGIEGAFGDGWKWETSWQSGRTRLELDRNDYSPYAMQKAVNGCNTSTGFNANALILIARYEAVSGKTCTAFNPFGVGRNSAAALSYIQNDTYQIQHMALDVGAASISGTPFSVPAGDVAVATGVEWRHESMSADSDPVSRHGIDPEGGLLANNIVESHGHNSVKEIFAEVGVPLLKGAAYARSLDFNAAARVTDYELSGTVKTWKAGLTWEPLDTLRVRFTRSHDIRAPNLMSLFFTGGPNATNVNTLSLLVGTVGRNGTVYNPPGNTAPVGQPANNNTANAQLSVPVPGGSGNPALTPEIADTTTGGLVFTLGRFNASVDYYQIVMTDAIGNPGAQPSINFCIAGDRTYCNFITFNSSVAGGIQLLEPLLLNLNKQTIKGYDFEMAYRMPLGPGQFSVRGLVNYQPHNYTLNAITGQTTENANTLNNQPRISYNLTFSYDIGRWNTDVQIRGFGERRGNNVVYAADGTIDAGTVLGPEDAAISYRGNLATSSNTISKNRWPGQFYINPSVSFRINDHLNAFLNVDNLLDVEPPPLSASSIYDLIGRRYRFGVRANY